jgi:integrase
MIDRSLAPIHNLPADQNPALVYLASLARGSVPTQRSALRKIADVMGFNSEDWASIPWGSVRYQHVQFIRAQLQDVYGASTANRILTALRRTLHHAWKLGQIKEEDYRRMVDVEPIRGSEDDTESDLMGRALDTEEIVKLMNVCMADKSIAGTRDAAIIALGYGLGMRRAEVAKMRLDHYDRKKGIVKVRSGKGNKSRTIPIEGGAHDALEDWIGIRGRAAGLMFYGISKSGKIHTRQLNTRAVNELYEKRAMMAGIDTTHFHDLRRTFVTDLLDRGEDVSMVARLAGHSDPRTTLHYDRRTMDKRRKAIRALDIPYRKRA